jgi:hypothetical protein
MRKTRDSRIPGGSGTDPAVLSVPGEESTLHESPLQPCLTWDPGSQMDFAIAGPGSCSCEPRSITITGYQPSARLLDLDAVKAFVLVADLSSFTRVAEVQDTSLRSTVMLQKNPEDESVRDQK